MSLKRECDRCHHLALVDSLNGKEFRVIQIVHRSTTTIISNKTYDLCGDCVLSLGKWLETEP